MPLKVELYQEKEKNFDAFELWKEYEGVAMHFNDLLLKIRTQSLAAVAAFATVAGLVVKDSAVTPELRWGTLTVVFISLAIFWIAIWVLDFRYYNRLLLGAVAGLVALEKLTASGTLVPAIDLSTRIEDAVAVKGAAKREPFSLSGGRWIFYSLVLILLFFLAGLTAYQWRDALSREAMNRQKSTLCTVARVAENSARLECNFPTSWIPPAPSRSN